MKKIAILCLAIVLFSCSKEKTTKDVCWKCVYSTVNGRNYPDYNECNAGEDPKVPAIDVNGNDLSFHCTKN